MENSNLSPKQERFCEEYLKDLNGTQAAIRAGYSAQTAGSQAFDLLKKPEIQNHITVLRADLRKRVNVDVEFVVNGILGLIEKCEAAVPVTDREGNETGEYTVQAGPAMKGYELLSRHLGMLNDKLLVKDDSGVAERLVAARKRHGR